MEKQVVEQMSRIRSALGNQYTARYKSDGYGRADNFIINVQLNRARNRPALLKAIAAITREAGRGFDKDTLAWILEQSIKRHSEVQSLLILACTAFNKKTKEATVTTTETATEEPTEINIESLFDLGV